MVINVRGLSFPLTMEIPVAAKIVDIKLQIERILMINISSDRMDLTYNGHLLRDELSVKDYQITHEETLFAHKKIQVWIKTDPIYLYSLTIRYVTVGELKEMLHAGFGLDVKGKILQFPQGNNLDDRCNLSAYGVDDGSELYLV